MTRSNGLRVKNVQQQNLQFEAGWHVNGSAVAARRPKPLLPFTITPTMVLVILAGRADCGLGANFDARGARVR